MGPEAMSEAEVLEGHELHGQTGRPLSVNVVTPKGSITAREADEVIAPGVEGEFGLLPGHIPFVSALRAGVLVIRKGQERQVYAVGPGLLQVGAGGKAQILVGQAVPAQELDLEAARADKAKAEASLKAENVETRLLRAELDWAQARIDAHAAAHAETH